MQVYDEMVDTGVAWIGKTPYGWDVKKFNSLYRQTNAGEVIPKEFWDKTGAYLMYTASQKPIRSIFPDFPETKLTTENDILIARNGDGVIHNPQAGSIYTNVVQRVTLDPNIVIKSFLIYALKASLVYVHGQSNGDFIVSLNMGMWNNTRLPVPSMQAQQKIADFLDTETAKIDNLIAKQERLLQLLEEKRRATITHAVTRGLNPNVELKETNIPWLGQIPTNYSTMNIKKVFKIVNGSTPKSGISDYWDGDITWVTPSDLSKVSGSIISSSKRTITDSGLASCGASIVPKNSVILSSRAPIGSIAISGTELCTNQGCKALVPSTDVNPTYYYYVLYALVPILNMLGRGTTFLEISSEELSRLKIPVPPIVDQEKIASYLNDQETNVAAMKQKIQTQITLLRERRTSLISHAVTGKIKV